MGTRDWACDGVFAMVDETEGFSKQTDLRDCKARSQKREKGEGGIGLKKDGHDGWMDGWIVDEECELEMLNEMSCK